jgi:hypothetical protein
MDRQPNLDPALKAWLDNVIIPALVREFRAETRAVGDNERDRTRRQDSGTSIPEHVQ